MLMESLFSPSASFTTSHNFFLAESRTGTKLNLSWQTDTRRHDDSGPAIQAAPVESSSRGALNGATAIDTGKPSNAAPKGLVPIIPSPVSAYLSAHELDVRPAIRTRVVPEYPALAPIGQIETTSLTVLINEVGGVDGVAVSKPASAPVFDESAQQAFSTALFTPGIKNGKAVKSRLVIEVTFDTR